jgi:dipeptidyl-peptidase-4
LHSVPIWLEMRDKGSPCAAYHPSRQWLTAHGFNPDKAGSAEIHCAETFLRWSLTQPSMVLHELAHAYHHQVLGHNHAGIAAAYRHAVESKQYESVLYADGTKKRAYALNNEKEYFAELSEAWLGANDFFPFVRAEVIAHDPQMARVLKTIWSQ